jgi:hypothetical protein
MRPLKARTLRVVSKLRSKLTFANVVSLLALFVALGGTSYAVAKLPKNSVGSKQLRKSSVTSSKVKDRSLLATDFKAGQLPAGVQGPQGARGPSDGFQVSLNAPVTNLPSYFSDVLTLAVPAGNYFVTATLEASTPTAAAGGLNCRLTDGPLTQVTTRSTWVPGASAQPYPTTTLTLVGEFKIPQNVSAAEKSLGVDCSFSSPSALSIGQGNIAAVQLESVTGNPG